MASVFKSFIDNFRAKRKTDREIRDTKAQIRDRKAQVGMKQLENGTGKKPRTKMQADRKYGLYR